MSLTDKNLRNFRILREARALFFTFVRPPFAIVDRQIRFGADIHRAQARKWATVGHYDWKAYVELDDLSRALIKQVRDLAETEDAILDICCNVGRILNALASSGFSNLHGVDIMEEAIGNAPNIFPQLQSANLTCHNVVAFIENLPPQSFDWAVTQSATVELLHPSFKLHRQLKRVLRKGLIFILNERGHSYPRYWRFLLRRSGFAEVKHTRLTGELSLIAFVRVPK